MLTKNQIEVMLCIHNMLNCEECSMDGICDIGHEEFGIQSNYSKIIDCALNKLKHELING